MWSPCVVRSRIRRHGGDWNPQHPLLVFRANRVAFPETDHNLRFVITCGESVPAGKAACYLTRCFCILVELAATTACQKKRLVTFKQAAADKAVSANFDTSECSEHRDDFDLNRKRKHPFRR